MRLAAFSLLVFSCASAHVSYRIDDMAPHREQLIVVAARVADIPGVARSVRQTVNACGLSDDGDRLVCREIGVDFDVPLPPVGIGYRDSTSGVEITRVIDGGPAEIAGLRAGDTVLAVDGQTIPDAKTLRGALDATGRTAVIKLRRGEEILSCTVRR